MYVGVKAEKTKMRTEQGWSERERAGASCITSVRDKLHRMNHDKRYLMLSQVI